MYEDRPQNNDPEIHDTRTRYSLSPAKSFIDYSERKNSTLYRSVAIAVMPCHILTSSHVHIA